MAAARLPTPDGPWKRYACAGPRPRRPPAAAASPLPAQESSRRRPRISSAITSGGRLPSTVVIRSGNMLRAHGTRRRPSAGARAPHARSGRLPALRSAATSGSTRTTNVRSGSRPSVARGSARGRARHRGLARGPGRPARSRRSGRRPRPGRRRGRVRSRSRPARPARRRRGRPRPTGSSRRRRAAGAAPLRRAVCLRARGWRRRLVPPRAALRRGAPPAWSCRTRPGLRR